MFLYLLTNQHSHLSGLYYLPMVIIVHELNITKAQADKAMSELENSEMVVYDSDNEITWVVNMLKHQPGRGEKIVKSIEKQLHRLHSTPILVKFGEKYASWKIPFNFNTLTIPQEYPPDTQTIPPLIGSGSVLVSVKTLVGQNPDPAKEWILLFNELTGSHYKPETKSNLNHVRSQIAAGFTLDDARTVIEDRKRRWANDPEMAEYLRPETIFSRKHFESYLNAAIGGGGPGPDSPEVRAAVQKYRNELKGGSPAGHVRSRIRDSVPANVYAVFVKVIDG